MSTVTNGEETMWCGHCGVNTPTRHEGKAGSVKCYKTQLWFLAKEVDVSKNIKLTNQFVLLTDLKSRRCSSTSLRLLRSVKPETGVEMIILDAEVDQGASRTGSAFTFVTCNNANVVGVLRVKFMARENLMLHGLNHHKSMEHHLPGLPATE
ncbi:hypothetical protein HID58_024987, partial [Brassica napus]